MNIRIITSVAVAAGLALNLSGCGEKKELPRTPAPAAGGGQAHTDGAAEQQK